MNEKEDQGREAINEANEKNDETLNKKIPPIFPFQFFRALPAYLMTLPWYEEWTVKSILFFMGPFSWNFRLS